jgi:hypothetical protein
VTGPPRIARHGALVPGQGRSGERLDRQERTRVKLEHRNPDRHGAGWDDEREGVGGEGGWPLYLQRFADVAAGEA